MVPFLKSGVEFKKGTGIFEGIEVQIRHIAFEPVLASMELNFFVFTFSEKFR